MILYTAHYSIRHPARLDITQAGCARARRKGAPTPGAFLAPSADLLRWGLRCRTDAKGNATALAHAWQSYEEAYTSEVHMSIGRDRRPLDALLALPEVVAVCFCGEEYAALGQCHRFPAARLLAAFGADYCGEMKVETAPSRQMGLFGGDL